MRLDSSFSIFLIGLYFPTKSALRSHRAHVHRYQRVRNEPPSVFDNLDTVHLDDLKGATNVIEENRVSGEYLVRFGDAHCEWMALSPTHELVTSFDPKEVQNILFIEDEREWMMSPWLVDS